MPFQKGQIPNPSGAKYKRQWIAEKRRIAEARKTWEFLIKLRDGMVLERKQIGTDKDGEPIMADIVPSAKDLLNCCRQIFDRAIGLPRVEGEFGMDGQDRAVLFLDFLRMLIVYLNSTDPQASQYLEFHLRGFAEEMKLGSLSTVQPVPTIHRPQLR
jgi:hypothetical protein